MKGVKNYLKNVTKSMMYTASDVATKDLMPNVGEFLSVNEDIFKESFAVLKNPKGITKKLINSVAESKVFQAADYAMKNTFEDLKTGNFYNKEREERDSLKFAGFDEDEWSDLSEFGIDNDWESNIGKSSNDEVTAGDNKIVDSIEKTASASSIATANAITSAAEANIKSNRIGVSLLYNQNQKLFGGLHNDLSVMNASMASLLKLSSESFRNIDKNTSDFFTQSLKLNNERNAMLKEILEMQRNMYKSAQEKDAELNKNKKKTRWSDVNSSGMLDMKEYFGNVVKGNIKDILSSATGGIMDLSFGFGGKDENMLKQFGTAPLRFISEALVKGMIPATIKAASKELNNTLGNVFGTLMGRLANASNDSSNGILGMLSKVFGIRTGVNRNIDTSKYNKGPVPFDGITRKAIVEVIPTYLRRIEARMSGSEEKMFDYESGKWVSAKEIKAQYDNIKKNAINAGTRDLQQEMAFAINTRRKGAKDKYELDSFNKAVAQFWQFLYERNGIFNPKLSADANMIPSSFSELRNPKNYKAICQAFANYDADRNGARNFRLGTRLISGNVLAAKDNEEKQYRMLESSGYSAITQYFGSGGSRDINSHLKFSEDSKSYKLKDDRLLKVQDSSGNTIFDYLKKTVAELEWQRINGVRGTSVITSNGRITKSIDDIYKGLGKLSPSTVNEGGKRAEENARIAESAIAKIKSGKAVDFTNFTNDEQAILLEYANMIRDNATDEYAKEIRGYVEESEVSAWMDKNIFRTNVKSMNDVKKLIEKAEKENANTYDVSLNGDEKEVKGLTKIFGGLKKSQDFFAKLIATPAESFTNLLYSADKAIYDMMFKFDIKKEKAEKGEDGETEKKQYNGFMDFLTSKVSSTFESLSKKMTEKIIDPLKKKLGIDDDFEKRTKDAFSKVGSNILGQFINANKSVYGNVFDTVKKETATGEYNNDISGAELRRKDKRTAIANDINYVNGVTNIVDRKFMKIAKDNGVNLTNVGDINKAKELVRNSLSKQYYENTNGLKDAELADQDFNILAPYLNSSNVSDDDIANIISSLNFRNEVTGENRQAVINNAQRQYNQRQSGMDYFNDSDTVNSFKTRAVLEGILERYKNKQAVITAYKKSPNYNKDNALAVSKAYTNLVAYGPDNISVIDKNVLLNAGLTNTSTTKVVRGVLKNYSDSYISKSSRLESSYNTVIKKEAMNIIASKATFTNHASYNLIKDLNENSNIDLAKAEKIVAAFRGKKFLSDARKKSRSINAKYIQQEKNLSKVNFGNDYRKTLESEVLDLVANKDAYIKTKSYHALNTITEYNISSYRDADLKLIISNTKGKDYLDSLFDKSRKNTLYESRNHAKGTFGLPFKGNTMLSKGEMLFDDDGISVVDKTDAYSLNKPTHILSSYQSHPILKALGLNPGPRRTPGQDLSKESTIRNKLYNHAEGTNDSIKISGTDIDKLKENAKKYMPEGLAGGAAGGLISLLLGTFGGPLLGIAAGAAGNIVANDEALKTKLFGKISDKDNKRHGGELLNEDVMNTVNKYLPDTLKFGLAGILPGLITPLGPLGGLLIGGTIGFLKNNEKFSTKYFGENGKIVDNSTKSVLKKMLPAGGIGAALGIGTKFILGGPFGIVGNALIGSAIGMMTTTEEFQDGVLGTKINGVRYGGVIGALKDSFKPLLETSTNIKDKLLNAIDNDILTPLGKYIKPTIFSLQRVLGILPRAINRFTENKMMRTLRGTLLGRAVGALGNGAMKLGGGVLGLGEKIVSIPTRALGHIGTNRGLKQIDQGWGIAQDMTAAERLQYREDNSGLWHKMKTGMSKKARDNAQRQLDIDRSLANIGSKGEASYNNAETLRDEILAATTSARDLDHAQRSANKNVTKLLNNLTFEDGAKLTPNQQKEVIEFINNGDLEGAQKYIATAKLHGRNGTLSSDEINKLFFGEGENLNSLIKNSISLNEQKRIVGNINSKSEKEAYMTQLKQKLQQYYGSSIDFTNMRNDELIKFAGRINTELMDRDANGTKNQIPLPELEDKELKEREVNSIEDIKELVNKILLAQLGTDEDKKRIMKDLNDQSSRFAVSNTEYQENLANTYREILGKDENGESIYDSLSDEAKNQFSTNKFDFKMAKKIASGNRDSGAINSLAQTTVKVARTILKIEHSGYTLDKDAITAIGKLSEPNLNTVKDALLRKPIMAIFTNRTITKEDIEFLASRNMNDISNMVKKAKDIAPYGTPNMSFKEFNNEYGEKIKNKLIDEKNKAVEQPPVNDDNTPFGGDSYDGADYYYNDAEPVPAMNGLGTFMLKGLKFGGKLVAKGARRGISKLTGGLSEKAIGVASSIGSFAKNHNPFSKSNNSNSIEANGTGMQYVPETNSYMKVEQKEDGSVEPDTSDAQTKDTLNKLSLKEKAKAKFEEVQSKAMNSINNVFGEGEDNKPKLKWYDLLVGAFFAVPVISKLFNTVIKPLWKNFVTPIWTNTVKPFISKIWSGTIQPFLTNTLPSLIGKAIGYAIKGIPQLIGGATNVLFGSSNNAGTSNTMAVDEVGESAVFYDNSGNQVSATDMIAGKEYKNTEGDTVTVDGKGNLTIKDKSSGASVIAGRVGRSAVNATVYGGKTARRLINSTDRIATAGLKSKGVIGKIAGAGMKLLNAPAKFITDFKSAASGGKATSKLVNKLFNKTTTTVSEEVVEGVATKITKEVTTDTKFAKLVKTVVSKVDDAVEKLFTNSTVVKKLTPLAEKLGASKPAQWITKIKDGIAKVFKKSVEESGEKAAKKAGSKIATGVLGKVVSIAFLITDFLWGCNHAEAMLGVEETGLLEEVACGITNALCNFLIIPSIFPGVNAMAKLVFGVFGDDLEERQKEADKITEQYNKENGTNLTTEERLNNDKTWFGGWKKKITSFFGGGKTTTKTENDVNNTINKYYTSTPTSSSTNKRPGYGTGSWAKQNDPSVRNVRFNAGYDSMYQTIGDSGCGPVSALNAVRASYGRGNSSILNAANYAIRGGYKELDGGTEPGFFSDYFASNGLGSQTTYNKNAIANNILSGRPTVLMGRDPRGTNRNNPFGTNPHYVTVTGMSNGKAIVQDPESKYDNQLYNITDLINKSSFGVSTYGRSKYGRGTSNIKTDSNGLITSGTVIDVPVVGNVHTYMCWQGISDPTSKQYKLRKEAGMKFDSEGFGVINGRYVIACSQTFGDTGDYIDFYKDNGIVLPTIVGDIKSSGDSNYCKWGHMYGDNISIVEFVVDRDTWYNKANGGNASRMHDNPGNPSCHPEWASSIYRAVNGGSYWNGNESFTGAQATKAVKTGSIPTSSSSSGSSSGSTSSTTSTGIIEQLSSSISNLYENSNVTRAINSLYDIKTDQYDALFGNINTSSDTNSYSTSSGERTSGGHRMTGRSGSGTGNKPLSKYGTFARTLSSGRGSYVPISNYGRATSIQSSDNYSQLINVVIQILMTIADNTDKLSTISSIMQEKLGVTVSAADLSNATKSTNTLKAKIQEALSKTSARDDNDSSYMTSIVSAMSTIAAQ